MKDSIKYEFGTIFGPAGKSAGIGFCIVAVIMAFVEIKALFLLPFGILMAFTCSFCIIDPESRKIKQGIQICKLLEFGKWENIYSNMSLFLTPFSKSFRYYSRSNRSIDVATSSCRIILFDPKNKRKIPIGDFKSLKEGKEQLRNLSEQLKLEIKTPQ